MGTIVSAAEHLNRLCKAVGSDVVVAGAAVNVAVGNTRDLGRALTRVRAELGRRTPVRSQTPAQAAEAFWRLVAARPEPDWFAARQTVIADQPALAKRAQVEPDPAQWRQDSLFYLHEFLSRSVAWQRKRPRWPEWRCRAAVAREHPDLKIAAFSEDPATRYEHALHWEFTVHGCVTDAYEHAGSALPEGASMYHARRR